MDDLGSSSAQRLGYRRGYLLHAEILQTVSLPPRPRMTEADGQDVAWAVHSVVFTNRR